MKRLSMTCVCGSNWAHTQECYEFQCERFKKVDVTIQIWVNGEHIETTTKLSLRQFKQLMEVHRNKEKVFITGVEISNKGQDIF